MCLEQLMKLLPPPPNPNYVGSDKAWEDAERRLGTPFPSGYKKWLEVYGVGGISDWLWLADPFPSELPHSNIFDRTALTREAKTLRVSEELGGKISTSEILTIGCDENGNLLHWHMVGEPDEWPLIYASLDGMDCDRLEMSFTRFLYHWLADELIPTVVDHYDLFSDRGRFYRRVEMR